LNEAETKDKGPRKKRSRKRRFPAYLAGAFAALLLLAAVGVHFYAPVFLRNALEKQAAAAGLRFRASKITASPFAGTASVKELLLTRPTQAEVVCSLAELKIRFSLLRLLTGKGRVNLEMIGPGEINLGPVPSLDAESPASKGKSPIKVANVKLSAISFSALLPRGKGADRRIELEIEEGTLGIVKPLREGSKESLHGRLSARDVFLDGQLICKSCRVEAAGALFGTHLDIDRFVLKLPELQADLNLSGYVGERRGKRRMSLTVEAQSDLEKLLESIPLSAFPQGAQQAISEINAQLKGFARLKAELDTPDSGVPSIKGYLDLSGAGLLLGKNFRKNTDIPASIGFQMDIVWSDDDKVEIKVNRIKALCGPVALEASLKKRTAEELQVEFRLVFSEPLSLSEFYESLDQVSAALADLVIVDGAIEGKLTVKLGPERPTLTEGRIEFDRVVLNHPKISEGPLTVSGRVEKQARFLRFRGLQFALPRTMIVVDGDVDPSDNFTRAELSVYIPKMDAFRAGGYCRKAIKLLMPEAWAPKGAPSAGKPSGKPKLDLSAVAAEIRNTLHKHNLNISVRADDVDFSGFGMALRTASLAFSADPDNISLDRVSLGLREGVLWMRGQLDLHERSPRYSLSLGGAGLQIPTFCRDIVRLSETLEELGVYEETTLKPAHAAGAASPDTDENEKGDLPLLFFGTFSHDGGKTLDLRTLRIKMPGLDLHANAQIVVDENRISAVKADVFLPEFNRDQLDRSIAAFRNNIAVRTSLQYDANDLVKALERTTVDLHLRADNIFRPSRGLNTSAIALKARLKELRLDLERLDVRTQGTAFRISGSGMIDEDGPRKVRINVIGPGIELHEMQMQTWLLVDALTFERLRRFAPSMEADFQKRLEMLREMDLVASIRLNDITLPEVLKDFKGAVVIDYAAKPDRLKGNFNFDFGHSLVNVSAVVDRLCSPRKRVKVTVLAPYIDYVELDADRKQIAGYAAGALNQLPPLSEIIEGGREADPAALLSRIDLSLSVFAGRIYNYELEGYSTGDIEDVRVEAVNDKAKLKFPRLRFGIFRGQAVMDESTIDFSRTPPVGVLRVNLQRLRASELMSKIVDEHIFKGMTFSGEFALSGTFLVPLAPYTTMKERLEESESKTKTLGDARWWVTLGTIKGHTTPEYVRKIFPPLDYQLYDFEQVVGVMNINGLKRKNTLLFKGLDGLDLEIRGESKLKLAREADKDILLTEMSYEMLADLRRTLSLTHRQMSATADVGKVPLLNYRGKLIRRHPRKLFDDMEVQEETIEWRPQEQVLSLLRDNVLIPARDVLSLAFIQSRLADIIILPGKVLFKAFSGKKGRQE